ncbi:MAG: helix-turn-helix domain-containing protein [Actinobacteria bacterium]|nr:helix-turn-helix domain-containing protein [Actinomycetota bacterium]
MSIEAAMWDLSRRLAGRIPEVTAEIQARFREDVPEYYESGDPALLEIEQRTIASSLREIADGLAHGRTLPEHPPGTATDEARLAAQAGIDLQALLQTHRIGQALFLQSILEEAEAGIADSQTRLAVLRLASQFQFEWNDRVTAAVVEAYQSERDLLFRDRERLKREIVRDVLRGMPADTSKLSYNFRGDHIALVAWGNSPEEALGRMASTVDGTLFTVPGVGGALFGWITRKDLRDAGDAWISESYLPDATRVALGEPATGIEGFRSSHRQAVQAHRVAHVRDSVITRYGEVALEALVIRDLQLARDFVTYELKAISDDDHRDTVLRTTLRAYFQTGQNASSAAHLLGVHERTIAYRLRSIEERIGATIAARRDELAMALRLLDLLEETGAATHVADGEELVASQEERV